ncbi:MAG TPA: hypothetical protein VMT17_07640 [Anaeromyxobacteraceae bacterium]|nr:hypothetical protein [Anaeromyxobacteraceae bacterium]
MKRVLALAALAASAVVRVASAQEPGKPAEHAKGAEHHHYLVSLRHEPEDCIRLLEDWEKDHKVLLARTEWGCASGTHSGWVLVEATSEQAAVAQVPASNRAGAKAVMVEVLSKPDQLKKIHQQLQQANALQKSE